MGAALRNERAKQFILDKLEVASTLTEIDFENLEDYNNLSQILQNLIFVKPNGFRGLVATAITGKFLNPDFDPLNNFYGCNPRSIFEKGIFYGFENRIPCGKSDPLNVAKNVNILNEDWVQGKRPESAAQAVVDYLRCLASSREDEQEHLINFFFFKLLEYANSIASIVINLPKGQEISNQIFASKVSQFVLEYPESGTIPQLVISILLEKLYENSDTTVKGGNESVFGTNTTSKKPADIWLENNNTPRSLFEITVKKIDEKRLDDCILSLNSLDMLSLPVNFICRLPNDVNTLQGIQGRAINYKGKMFNFIDINSFILSISCLLSAIQINDILIELQRFIQAIDRPLATKEGWNKIFI